MRVVRVGYFKWLDFRYVWKEEPIQFTDGLDLKYERKVKLKDNLRFLV